ncbi:hypothetical protein FRC17_001684, partial [Serendipita sp. 399]
MSSKHSGPNTTRAPSRARGLPDTPETAILDTAFDPNVPILAPNGTPFTPLDDPERDSLPWYKRPSPGWVLIGTFIAAISIATTLAPRVEVYIKLVCQEIRPEYEALDFVRPPGGVMDWPSTLGSITIPRPSTKCQADPEVQQAAASIGALITSIMGILSCLTAGWWGKFCDRHGRVKMLSITLFGAVISDLVFILVALSSEKLPGGYRFLTAAPIVDGVLGGIATGSAATHAYLSDTTTSLNRSRIFSFMLGLLFGGMAVGPVIGGLLITRTGNLLSVFYLSFIVHILYFFMTLTVVPESLTKEAMESNRKRANPEATDVPSDQQTWKHMNTLQRATKVFRVVFFFLTPLSVFLPQQVGNSQRKNWNLTLLAIAYGIVTLLIGSYQFKFQYANYTFGWTSQQLGYWLSVIGALRAIHLIFILPAFIKFFKPRYSSGQPNSPNEESSNLPAGLPHDVRFDLLVIRLSLLVELCQYTIAILSQNAIVWTAATVISAFSGGITPSIQALAVELSKPTIPSSSSARESTANEEDTQNFGQLFGALAVLQALCSSILGPSLFGTIFVATIRTFPKAIFVAGWCIVFVDFICVSLIGVPGRVAVDEEREPLLS